MRDDNEHHFVVWGTGFYAKKTVNYLEELSEAFEDFHYCIEAYIDSNIEKQNSVINGVSVYSPENLDQVDNGFIVIVAIYHKDDVEKILVEKGRSYITAYSLLCKECIAVKLLKSSLREKVDWNNPLVIRNTERLLIDDKNYRLENNKDKFSIQHMCAVIGEFNYRIDKASVYCTGWEVPEKKSKRTVIGIYYDRLYSGGVERVISKTIPMYIQMGYEIVLFTHEISDLDYEIPIGVTRYTIGFDPLMPYIWLNKLYKAIEFYKIDVFINHAHADWRSYYLGICIKTLGIRYIVESHTSIGAIIAGSKLNYYRSIYSLADELVVLSIKDMDYWNAEGIHTTYIPNPIGQAVMDMSIQYDRNKIIWVGRIDENEKNIYDIIPIIERVKRIIPNVKLFVLGRADKEIILNNFLNRITEKKLNDNIEICGYSTELDKHYQSAALIIFTSLQEGFNMALAEAMSYGCPAVMYKIDGLELSKKNKGLISIENRDYEKYAQAVVSILKDSLLREHLSIEAIENIEDMKKIDIKKRWKDVFAC